MFNIVGHTTIKKKIPHMPSTFTHIDELLGALTHSPQSSSNIREFWKMNPADVE